MRYILAASIFLSPALALAQTGPSFDCAKASNAIERAVCKDPALGKADRELSSLYSALLNRLSGPAKESLQKGQLAWVANRNRACASTDAEEVQACVKRRYETRIADLKASGSGTYPFVETQWIESRGKVGKISYAIDIAYPRFAGKGADFSAVNKAYAEAATTQARETTPAADADADRQQQWSAEGGYALYRPGAEAITVASSFWAFTGGAHGYGSVSCQLVDLKTGRKVEPAGVFAAGSRWLEEIVAIAGADLKKQFVENPGFDDALRPAELTKTLRDGGHYCWQAGRLQLYFNQYEVGPYAAGPYTVDIPYSKLKPLLRAGGPIN